MCRGSAVDVDVSRRKSSFGLLLFATYINGAKDKETGDGQTPKMQVLVDRWVSHLLPLYRTVRPFSLLYLVNIGEDRNKVHAELSWPFCLQDT